MEVLFATTCDTTHCQYGSKPELFPVQEKKKLHSVLMLGAFLWFLVFIHFIHHRGASHITPPSMQCRISPSRLKTRCCRAWSARPWRRAFPLRKTKAGPASHQTATQNFTTMPGMGTRVMTLLWALWGNRYVHLGCVKFRAYALITYFPYRELCVKLECLHFIADGWCSSSSSSSSSSTQLHGGNEGHCHQWWIPQSV